MLALCSLSCATFGGRLNHMPKILADFYGTLDNFICVLLLIIFLGVLQKYSLVVLWLMGHQSLSLNYLKSKWSVFTYCGHCLLLPVTKPELPHTLQPAEGLCAVQCSSWFPFQSLVELLHHAGQWCDVCILQHMQWKSTSQGKHVKILQTTNWIRHLKIYSLG